MKTLPLASRIIDYLLNNLILVNSQNVSSRSTVGNQQENQFIHEFNRLGKYYKERIIYICIISFLNTNTPSKGADQKFSVRRVVFSN